MIIPYFQWNMELAGEWTDKALGLGYSLVPVELDENALPDNPNSWRESFQFYGSPEQGMIY